MRPPTLFLASQSPRRYELLQSVGITPIPIPTDPTVDAEAIETPFENEDPIRYVTRIANLKRDLAQERLVQRPPAGLPIVHEMDLILAADTTVALGIEILGKPENASAAYAMLEKLSGKTHQVHTTVSICRADGQQKQSVTVSSDVTFARLTHAWITNYTATREPMDKAGGYGIQGLAGSMIPKISGSYTGIMGLPLYETLELIRQATRA